MQFGSRLGLTISGSKLVTWYDVFCNKRGGGDYVLVVKFSSGDYVLVVKFSRGDYVPVVKLVGGILSTYTKMSRGGGGLSRGDFVLHSSICYTCTMSAHCIQVYISLAT